MRRFVLDRTEDISGVSGVGTVAEGVQFSDGECVIRWKTVPVASTAIYDSVEDMITIHGHDGATQIRWIDDSIGEKSAEDGKTSGEEITDRIGSGEYTGWPTTHRADAMRDIPSVWRPDGTDI